MCVGGRREEVEECVYISTFVFAGEKKGVSLSVCACVRACVSVCACMHVCMHECVFCT